jgi:hypothetical protein
LLHETIPDLKHIFFFLFSFLFFFPSAKSQTDTCHLQISLLTCSPGEELYSTFGHSALRVQDISTGLDIIYNYGTFEFNEDFYVKFVKGRLRYFVSVENFADFKNQYQYESRSIQEQKLQITCSEKQQLFSALQTNAKEENKYYQYDFLFDNCSTRLRDIVANNTKSKVIFNNILPNHIPTFRNLLYTYLDNGAQHWSKFGIDLLLGSRIDRKATTEQAMFLPDYLSKGFDKATVDQMPLVTPPVTILNMPSPLKGSSLFQPKFVFSALLLLIIILSFIPNKKIRKFVEVFDFLFFFFIGLAGCLMLFMWFGTDHALTRDNFNLLWALPTHALAAFFLWKESKWMNYYLLASIISGSFLLVGWIFLPQELNLAVIPIILLILLRSWLIILKPHYHAHTETL